jgi:hypothetical protein
MPLRGRRRTQRYNNNAGGLTIFGSRVGRLLQKNAAENGTHSARSRARHVHFMCAGDPRWERATNSASVEQATALRPSI